MRGARRSLLLCAAGLASAAGCTLDTPSLAAPPLARTAAAPHVPAGPSITPPPASLQAGRGPLPAGPPPVAADETPLPINLATALRLSNARPLDVQIAARQAAVAAAVLDRARLLWVPNLVLGTDSFAHAGNQQNFAGDVVKSTRSAFMAGLGPN